MSIENSKIMFQDQVNAFFGKDIKKLNKQILADTYVDSNDPYEKSACFAALVLKYWPKINSMNFNYGFAISPEECYDCIVEAILYVLQKHRWRDKDSSIYNDSYGADKAINRKIKNTRMNLVNSKFAPKRVSELNSLSIEGLIEDQEDYVIPSDLQYEEENAVDIFVKDIIKKYLADGDLFTALVLDGILSCSCFNSNNIFEYKKLILHLRDMREYYKIFQAQYKFEDTDKLLKAVEKLSSMPFSVLKDKIDDVFLELQTTIFNGYTPKEQNEYTSIFL